MENAIVAKILEWKIIGGKIFYEISVSVLNHKYGIQKRYSDFTLLHSLLIEKGLNLLPSLPPKTFFSNNQDPEFIKERIRGLQLYMTTLLSRHDVISTPLFLKFLQFPEHQLGRLNFNLFKLQLIAEVNCIKQSVTTLYFENVPFTNNPLLFLCYQESSPLSRLGKVWSIIETEESGAVFAWNMFSNKSNTLNENLSIPEFNVSYPNAIYSLTTNNTIQSSKFNCLLYSSFPFKCKNLVYNPTQDTIYVTTDNGNIEIYKYVFSRLKTQAIAHLDGNSKATIQLHNSNIVQTHTPFLSNKNLNHKYSLSIGSDNSVRLFCYEQMKLISGGNLNKRLNNSRLTCCHLESKFGKIGFFGSSSGQILILDMASQPPYYITDINPPSDSRNQVSCIVNVDNTLLVAYSNIVKLYRIEINAKQASCILKDSQPIRSIDPSFASDMSVGIINSIYMHGNDYILIGSTNLLSLFKLNIDKKLKSPKLIFSYEVHSGPISCISAVPEELIKESNTSSKNLNLVTAGEDGNILFWKISNIPTSNREEYGISNKAQEETFNYESEDKAISQNMNLTYSSENSDEDLTSAFR
ncbi:PX and WD40 domain protein [Cryptosporidium ryanae]|uniref:PX and WD40 domain protein n=1 Tax=Cryptosporidium ryanae TaxID=515981 RepID=UPI00351A05D2|nr:PX and WD40 domain protein [Cryptosporidium ryanae]